MKRCMTFLSPGPPFYAARCRLEAGHAGKCNFPTAEEAKEAFYSSVRRLYEKEAQRQAQVSHASTFDAEEATLP